jgi:hypothetical protein
MASGASDATIHDRTLDTAAAPTTSQGQSFPSSRKDTTMLIRASRLH